MSDTLALVEPQQQIVSVSESALSVEQLLSQRRLITEAMSKAMKEGDHYGKIPGCGDKPTLLQPGAQLLAHLFRLRPEYEVIESDLPHGHKRFRVTCKLFFIGAVPEIKIGEGVGESSSMESKHRYRNAAVVVEPTKDIVPKTYWDIKHEQGSEAANKWLSPSYDNQAVGVRKIEGEWRIVILKGGSEEKVENPNPADVFNTVLKIAKKRAFVDATITATASSDFFTQDLEDIRANLEAVETASGTNGDGPKTAAVKSKATKTRKGKAAAAVTASSGEDQIPMFNGPKHELLASSLKQSRTSEEDFMAAAKFAKLIPENAKAFRLMSEATAARFVDDPEIIDRMMTAWKEGKPA